MNVYSLLIVDDENIIRKGLRVIIDDLGFSFREVVEAENGVQALAIYEKHKPDIIIVDIQMPHMDGIEFLKKIRDIGADSRVIIFSGYSEFEYAREAIRFKVTEYLLKPIKRQDLEAALKRALDDLDQEKGTEELPPGSLSETDGNMLKDMLLSAGGSDEVFQMFLSERRIEMPCPHFIILYAQFTHLQLFLDAGQGSILPATMLGSKLVAVFPQVLSVPHVKNSVISIINIKKGDGLRELRASLTEINEYLREKGLRVNWGVSGISSKSVPLYTLFRQAKAAFMEKLVYGEGGIYFADELPKLANTLHFNESDITQMISMLRMMDTGRLEVFINQRCNETSIKGIVTVKEYQDKLYSLLIQVGSGINGSEKAGVFMANNIYQFVEELEECTSLPAANKRFIDTLVLISTYDYKEGTKSGDNKSVALVKLFIQKNFHKVINLDMLANQVSMNPSYFSVLFKKEEGISLTDYIVSVRIIKAMEYLRDPQFKVYEVATKTGFNDEKYFSKVFKKNVGITPKEYKEKSIFYM
jgi:two-component system response regulator YesN